MNFIILILLFILPFQQTECTLEKQEICQLPDHVSISVDFIVISKNERIYLRDRFDQTISVYDFKGNLKSSFGRKGNGPGEYQRIEKLKIINNIIFVYDDYQKRISLLNLQDGEFIKSFRLNNYVHRVKDCDLYFDDNELRIVFTGFSLKEDLERYTMDSAINDEVIYILDQNSKLIVSFGERIKIKKWEPFNQMLAGGGISIYNNSVFYTQRYPYKIVEYSLEGKEIRSFTDKNRLIEPDFEVISVNSKNDGRRYGPFELSFRIYATENFIINSYNKLGKEKGFGRSQFDIFDRNLNLLNTHSNKDREGGLFREIITVDPSEKDIIYFLSEDAEKEKIVFGKYIIKKKEKN